MRSRPSPLRTSAWAKSQSGSASARALSTGPSIPHERHLTRATFSSVLRIGKHQMESTKMLISMTPTLKAAAEKAARDDARSLPSFFEKLLSDHLTATGYLPSGEVTASQ